MAFPLTETEHNYIESRIQEIPEIIVAAAVRFDDVIVFKERPGRHADAHTFNGVHSRDHGFITSRGRFVGRQEAARIVKETGQGSAREYPGYEPSLFSEDMWHDISFEGPFISQERKDEYTQSLQRDIARRTGQYDVVQD
jgi:hypothetical protein